MVRTAGSPRTLGTLLVAVLLLTAGCSSVLDGDGTRTPFGVPDGGQEATASGSTEPVPATVGRTSTRPGSDPADLGADDPRFPVLEVEELAPGLTPEAVISPDRLASAHRRVLDNRSFRVRYRRVEARATGNRTLTVLAELSADRRRYRVRRTARRPEDGPRARSVTAYWSDGNRTLRMITFGDTRTVGRLPSNRSFVDLPEVGDQVRESLVRWAFAATVVESVEDVPSAIAPAKYRVESDEGVRPPAKFRVNATGDGTRMRTPDRTPVRNASLQAVVDSRGVVRSLRFSYDWPGEDGPVEVVVTMAVEGIGTTDPAPPTWVDDASEEGNGTDPIGGT